MNELQKNNKAMQAIGAILKKEGGPEKLAEAVRGIIFETYQYCGQRAEAESAAIAAEFYVKDLRKFPSLTLAEIRTIFERGRVGQYGEYFGLNAKTFYQWTEAYVYDENGHKAYVMATAARVPAAKMLGAGHEKSEQERRDEEIAALNKDFRNFRKQMAGRIEAGNLADIIGREDNSNKLGTPLWDFDRTEWEGSRAALCRSFGATGKNLREIFMAAIEADARQLIGIGKVEGAFLMAN